MAKQKSEEDERPLIGLVGWLDDARWVGGLYGAKAVFVEASFIDKLAAAGADAVVLPPQIGITPFAEHLDGIVLAGGHDLPAHHYGGEDGPDAFFGDERRDEADLAFANFSLRNRVPLLAVCRGCQVVNVAAGGTLVGHVPDAFTGVAHTHVGEDGERGFASHEVEACHPVVEAILGPRFEVRSWHHQAVDEIGPGLRPAAQSSDGLMEAIVADNHPFLLGVQWHPETHQASELFDALVAAAADYKKSRV